MKSVGLKSDKYLMLALEVCKIAGVMVDPSDTIDSILTKLRELQKTPYFSKTQKEIRKILGNIIRGIEKKENTKKIRENINKFEDAINYDLYWD